MYDHTCTEMDIDAARRYIFTYKKQPLENLPPMKDALLQQILRTCCQAGHVWVQSFIKNPELLTSVKLGMEGDEGNGWPVPAGSVVR